MLTVCNIRKFERKSEDLQRKKLEGDFYIIEADFLVLCQNTKYKLTPNFSSEYGFPRIRINSESLGITCSKGELYIPK